MNDSNDDLAELLALTLTVDEFGTRTYRNSSGQLHRQHGPAVECADGYKEWYQNDQLHRTTGPALEYGDGARMWYQNDQIHRTTGPAVEWSNGTKEWWLNGRQVSEREFHDVLAELLTLTVTVDQHGTRFYSNSQGMWHRVHGPAVIWADGYKSWWLNGRLHRTTGPAIEWPDGARAWYLDGQPLSEKEFHDRLK